MTLGFLMRLELIAPGKHHRRRPDLQRHVHAPRRDHDLPVRHPRDCRRRSATSSCPSMIGAKDVHFPRLNLLSWWLFLTGAILAVISLFTGGGPPDTGWTFYVPYSIRTGTNVTLAVFAVFILGFSSILTGLNFVTTIHRMRAPGMTCFRHAALRLVALRHRVGPDARDPDRRHHAGADHGGARRRHRRLRPGARAATRSSTSTCSGSTRTRPSTS